MDIPIFHNSLKTCPFCHHLPGPYYKVAILSEEIAHGYKKCRSCQSSYIVAKKIIPRYQPSNGYFMATIPVISETATFSSQIIPMHRLVWELHYGKLPPGYIVHHINGDRGDNRIENLIGIPRTKHNCHKGFPKLRVVVV